MSTRAELFRKWADVVELAEMHGLDPRLGLKHWRAVWGIGCDYPVFDSNPDDYTFALAVVEARFVFPGDVLYYDGKQTRVAAPRRHPEHWSWNPPKPQTFKLGGKEFPVLSDIAAATAVDRILEFFARDTATPAYNRGLGDTLCKLFQGKLPEGDRPVLQPWNGGEMPVPRGTPVWVQYRDRTMACTTAGSLAAVNWGHKGYGGDIIGWCVATTAFPEPWK